MIPKIIHYCWFGPHKKSAAIERAIASWKQVCPDFEIREWNEKNFPYTTSPFTIRMYNEGRFAFVADYARLHILLAHGGFYLDTDMLLLKSLSSFTSEECVLGEEERGIISAGMIGAKSGHPFIAQCKAYYDAHDNELITIPRVLSQVFTSYEDRSSLLVLPPTTFYPFDSNHIHLYRGQALGDNVYGVHLWDYSWGHPLNKFFKKIGVYRLGKRIVEILGIKKVLKKILGFI
jgi:hypothetical protein